MFARLFSRKSCRKRSFSKSGFLFIFEEVLQKTLLFEVWIFICGGNLAEKVPFGIGLLTQACFQEHRFKNVIAAAASRTLPQAPLHTTDTASRRYPSCRFKNVSAVTALSRSSFQDWHRCRRSKKVTADAARRKLPRS